MFSFILFISLLNLLCVECVLYSRYTGKQLNGTEIRDFKNQNLTKECTIDVAPCTPFEGSRVDGTCNNFKYPTAGSAMGTYLRLLKPDYSSNGTLRVTSSGKPLPSARLVRTTLEPTGIHVDRMTFNMAAAHFSSLIAFDLSAANGILDYIKEKPKCCEPEGKSDRRCIPIKVPDNDPYLRKTDVRCLNVYRVKTFQDLGCASTAKGPEQINFQTPVLDLSVVYGVSEEALSRVRDDVDGLLKMEVRNNRYVPLGDAPSENCRGNRANETVCYRFGDPHIGNFDVRLSTFAIFFMREHNRIAKFLKKINPCWRNDRLFKVARQINIATASNLFLYELLPILMGYKHMLNYGLITPRFEHITAYDSNAVPLMYAEYVIAARYFHTLVDGQIKMFNDKYHYTGEVSLSDTLFRPGFIELDNNFDAINKGTFYQSSAKLDDIQDPEISEHFYKKLERAHDLRAIDIQRGRDFGLRGYNHYRKFCGIKSANSFEDFMDTMSIEKIQALKSIYENASDVDLLAGVMSESFISGTFVGPTLFCILVKQLQLMKYSDRFWFERAGQLHSFKLAQLIEIRKTNMARIACDNADGVQFMQPHGFLNVGPGNEPIPCTHIPGPDLTKWRDDSCQKHKQSLNKPLHRVP